VESGFRRVWPAVPPPAVPPATGTVDVGNAWKVFESLDLALAAIGIAALYSAWEQFTGRFRFGEGWLLPAVANVSLASSSNPARETRPLGGEPLRTQAE
jgi:hypothetical protein